MAIACSRKADAASFSVSRLYPTGECTRVGTGDGLGDEIGVVFADETGDGVGDRI